MINRNYILDLMKSKTVSIDEFNYDKLACPPLLSMFTLEDIWKLKNIATSIKYAAKVELKFQEIDKIMRSRGFVKFVAGTNRICYRPVESDLFVIKVAYDKVAMDDNIKEYTNQYYLKPFCTKVFEVAGDGVIASFERVMPITNREEYISVAEDVYTLINEFIIGEYIMEDIGSKYHMNIGIRRGFGVVLLDFPYLFKLDGKKLFCTRPDPLSSSGKCDGEIDYDDGFNNLICKKCGAIYRASELAVEIKNNNVILRERGEHKMKVSVTGGTHAANKVVENEFVAAKAMPSKPISSNTKGFKLASSEKKDEVTVNGVPEVKEEKVVVEETAKKEESKKEVINPIKFTNKEEANKKEVSKKEEAPAKPMSYVDYYKDLKEAANAVDTNLMAILNNKSSNNKPQSRKIAIDLIVKLIGKLLPTMTPEEITKVIKGLFDTEFLRVDLVPSEDNDTYSICANISDKNDNVIYTGIAQTSFAITESEDEEASVEYTEVEAEPVAYGEDDYHLTDEEIFSAKVIDIKEIFANKEHRNVIVIEDINGTYLTVGEYGDKLLTIDNLNDQSVDALSFVSTEYLNNTLKTLDELSEQISEMESDEEDVTDEEAEAEGKEVYDIPVGVLPPEVSDNMFVNGVPDAEETEAEGSFILNITKDDTDEEIKEEGSNE